MGDAGGGEHAASAGGGLNDEGAFNDFNDVVEGIVIAVDEGGTDEDVDAAGEEAFMSRMSGSIVGKGSLVVGWIEDSALASSVVLSWKGVDVVSC